MSAAHSHDALPEVAEAVDRNIRTLREVRRQMDRRKGLEDRIADVITRFSGSMAFLYVHIVWFAVWILMNLGWAGTQPFDPFPFGLLTMIVSLEAIVLSTFVLISQNRLSEMSDRRADLDLQVNLLAEYEITKILCIVDAIADHLGLDAGNDVELEDLKKHISPHAVLRKMDEPEVRRQTRAKAAPPSA